MNKTILLGLMLCLMLLMFASCDDNSNTFTNITGELSYTTFLELLEANGISFVETESEEWDVGFLSVPPRHIYVDGEQITIYEFPSNHAMETDAGFVNISGFGIDNLNTGYIVRISWASHPYWFKRDLIIVNYVGTNRQIIGFLRETLQQFAGHGVDNDVIDERDVTIEEYVSSSNELNLPFLYIENLIGEGFRTIRLTTSWTFFDEYGNIVGGINSDSPHPLQLSPQAFDSGASIAIRYNPNLPSYLEFLGMSFLYGEPARTHIPHSITVTRWKIDYASGNHNVIGDDEGETVGLINPSYPVILNPGHLNEMIPILADGYDYIYMVEAVWQEGSSIFTFRTTSLLIDEPGNPPSPIQSDSSYEVGRVWLVADGNEHNPGEHFIHGANNTEHGLLSASGIPFEFWLANNLNNLQEIQYTPNMRIMIDGEYGRVVTFPQEHPMYFEGYRQIGVSAENFVDGVAAVTLPLDSGTYLMYVDVTWSGGGNDFSRLRYIFKIVREIEFDSIPGQSPSLYINISAEGIESQRINAAQGTTSWSWYEASGEHPLDFWRELWECIDFNRFKVSLDGAEGEVVVHLDFGFPPASIFVSWWSTEYIGLVSEMWNVYEAVEVEGNIFRFNNDGNDYIYQVEAIWAQGDNTFGRAFYTFRVNS